MRGPLGVPGVGGVWGAEGVDRSELRIGLDNTVIPEGSMISDSTGHDHRAVITTHTLFGTYGLSPEWTAGVGIPVQMDLPTDGDGRLVGWGDLRLFGIYSGEENHRRHWGAHFGLLVGTASRGKGMVPRSIEVLRSDNVSSPLGRRRIAAEAGGLVTQRWGSSRLSWIGRGQAGILFPTTDFPAALRGGLALEKQLPLDWAVGTDLTVIRLLKDLPRSTGRIGWAAKWGVSVIYETNRNFSAQGGIAWNLLRDGETEVIDGGDRFRWGVPKCVELRASFSWRTKLFSPPPPEPVRVIREAIPVAEPESEAPEVIPDVPFEEFDDWGDLTGCDEGEVRYSAPGGCGSDRKISGELKNGPLPGVSFFPGAVQWELRGFGVLDSLAGLLIARPGRQIVLVVPIEPVQTAGGKGITPELLAAKRGEALVSYLRARGVIREQIDWRISKGGELRIDLREEAEKGASGAVQE